MNHYQATDAEGQNLVTVQAQDESQARKKIKTALNTRERDKDYGAWLRGGARVRVLATQLSLFGVSG